jgi:hypothetical protein
MWELLSHLSLERARVVAEAKQVGAFSARGLIPSLTLPFARGGELFLERQQDVGELLAVARLLEVGDLAAAAIGDAGLRDLG